MGRWAIFNVLLGVIVLLLGLEIARTWARSLPPVDFSARPAEETPQSNGPRGEAHGRAKRGQAAQAPPSPATMVATIVNKDLFDPSRQKATDEPKAAVAKEAAPPPNLTLVGVRIFGHDTEAFVTDASQGNQQKRMRIGDQVSGYTVKTIEPRRVTLANAAGDVVKLDLTIEKSGGGAPPKPGQPPRPPVPGQPPGQSSTAAGVQGQSPAAGVPSRATRLPAGPGAAVHPPRPGMPGAPTPTPAPTPGIPNLPPGVREKLEQLKGT
jgi:hypothetical protein